MTAVVTRLAGARRAAVVRRLCSPAIGVGPAGRR